MNEPAKAYSAERIVVACEQIMLRARALEAKTGPTLWLENLADDLEELAGDIDEILKEIG